MRLAEEGLAYNSHFRALRQRSKRCTQACAAGSDDQYIVVVSFEFCRQNSLKSVIAPLATMRT